MKKILSCILILFGAVQLFGQTTGDYRSAHSGDWALASTWERFNGTSWVAAPSAPTSTDGVISILNSHTVTITTVVTADQVLVNTGGILSQSAQFIIADGTGNDLTVDGTWNFSSDQLTGPGNAVVSPSGILNLSSTNNKFISTPLTSNGTINWQDGPFLYNAAVTVTNNGSMNISGNNNFANNAGAGTFINNGTITKTSTGTTIFQMASFTNTGTIHLDAGTVRNISTFTNTGTLSFASGIFINEGGVTFNHNTGSVINGTGTFTNNGTVNLAVDQVFPSTLIFSIANNGSVNGAGNLTINNDFNLTGDITGTGTLTINGNTTWNSGTIGRTFTIGALNSLTLATTNNKFISGAITNNGTINWQDGPFLYNAAVTFTNNGSMNISGNNNFQNNAGAGTFINNGTITKTSTGTTIFQMASFTNTGTIHLDAGTVRNISTFTNTGTLSFASGIFINEGGVTFNHNTGSVINGTGTFTNNGTVNLAVDQVFPSTLIFSIANNGSVNGAGNLTINNDFNLTGDITGTGTLTINGNTTWNSGTIGRTFTIGALNSLTLTTTSNKFISGAITNNGTINWQDGPFLYNAAVTVTNNGSMNISGNNNFQNNAGAGTFINNGTITKTSTGTTIFQMASFTNTGTIHLDAGTVRNISTFTNTGTLSFASGIFINEGGVTFNHNTGSVINGTGTFTNNGTVNLAVDQVFPSTLIFSIANNGSVNGAGNLTINNDFNLTGDITGTGTLTINGNTTWNSGTIGRTFTIGALNSLTLTTTSNKFISGAITNNGTINWQDGPFLYNAAVTVTNNGSMNISGNNNFANNAAAGTFINNGTMAKTSPGNTTLSMGSFTNSPGATISGVGTMNIITTSFNSSGAISPGLSTTGLLTVNTQQPLSANSTLNIELKDGSGPGTGNDQLIRAGDMTLAGTLTVTETGTVPDGLYNIINLTTGTISGGFNTLNLPPGYTLQVGASIVQLNKNLALPLTLISFTAQKTTGNNALLLWQTDNEVNTSDFIVEQSADGISFAAIGDITAMGSGKNRYSYTSAFPTNITTVYYRLKMIDKDGKFTYSYVAKIDNGLSTDGALSIFPNPVKNATTISGLAGKGQILLFDVQGKLLQQIVVTNSTLLVNLSKYRDGIYIIQYRKDTETITTKLMKQ